MQPAIAGPGGNGRLGAPLTAGDTPLEVGTLLSARVVGAQGENVVLAVGGTRLALPATLALTLGQQVRLQVVRTASGQLGLRLVEPASVAPGPQRPMPPGALPAARPAPAAPALVPPRPRPPPPAEAPAGGPAARPEPFAGAALPEQPADRLGPPTVRAAVASGLADGMPAATSPAASRSGAAPSSVEADPLAEELPPQPRATSVPLAPRILAGDGAEPHTAALAGTTSTPRALSGPPLAWAGSSEPPGATWRDALAVLHELATRGTPDAPATRLAAATLGAWSAESLEAPALARWLRRVVHEVGVPSEAKRPAASASLAPEPRAIPRPATDARRGDERSPEPLAGDARSRLALLRAATTDTEAGWALDQLATQLTGEQARNALAPPGASAWCFTLPPPRPDHPTPLECRVAELPADGSAGETPARYSVQLRLALPQLGELLVDLHTAGEQARCQLLTTSPFAAALFAATAAELAQGLARAGYPGAAVEARVRPAPPARGDTPAPAARLDVRA